MDTPITIEDFTFELGPIRPPSEAASILLRLSRNCPWNQCVFCHTYKGTKFSRRTVEEVKHDIDSIYTIAQLIISTAEDMGTSIISRNIYDKLISEHNIDESYLRQVAFWLYHGMESLFLQDADSLVMKTDEVVEVLCYIREKFPSIKRITTYARAKTISRRSPEELKKLREAGLDRIHIGLESGSDTILRLIKKGVTAEEQINAGVKAMEAGFELSEYYMPGAGGKEHSEENARESARVLNAINPTFIRLRSVVPLPGTPLYDLMEKGEWVFISDEDKVKEIKLFLEGLEDITSTIKSDHMMNLLEDVEGKMPHDREKIMRPVEQFFAMSREDREKFTLGRRLNRFRFLSDYRDNPEITSLWNRIHKSYNSFDDAILEILTNYI